MTAPLPPELFGDFLLVQRLARRSATEVLVAVRLGDRSGRTFVVKRPTLGERASGRSAQAIEREGEVLAALRSPLFPQLEAHGALGGLPYIAIEHVRGVTLDELLSDGEALSEGSVHAIALDLAAALAELHRAGFVHGDVSPSNVIVDDAGDIKLLDLGLAKRAGEARDEVSGTAGYIAPEAALAGHASPASDVYGWAVVVAECALGRRLFPERDLASAASRGDLPRDLVSRGETITGLLDALKRDPKARPTSELLAKERAGARPDRAELCTRVEQKIRGEEKSVVEEAAPLVAPAAVAKTAAESLSKKTIAPTERPAAEAQKMVPLRWIVLAGAAVSLFVGGQVTARLSMRSARGSIAYAGAFPRRATLEVDGQKEVLPADGRLSLAPGEHTITLVLPKGTRREYTVRIRPNEHVVLLPARKGTSKDDEDTTEEREP